MGAHVLLRPSPAVDVTDLLPHVPLYMKELEEALVGQRVVACIGNYKWLGAFACIPPIYSTLVGAATTEEEGYALVQKQRPSMVFVSQHLDAGSGLSLVARIEALDASTKTVLVADDSDISVVRVALSMAATASASSPAGCCRRSRLSPAVGSTTRKRWPPCCGSGRWPHRWRRSALGRWRCCRG